MTALEHVPSERELRWIEKLVERARRSPFSPKWTKDEGGDAQTMAVLLTAWSLNLPVENLRVLDSFHVIDRRVEPSVDLYRSLVLRGGHELVTVEFGPDRSVVKARRAGSDEWQVFTFTLDMARHAGLLDQWVTVWRTSDRGGKKYPERYVVGDDRGLDEQLVEKLPADAKAVLDAGKIESRESWRKYPADMLEKRAAKRAAKAVAPDAVLGIDLWLGDQVAPAGGSGRSGEESQASDIRASHRPGDDDVIDVESEEVEPPEPPRQNPYARAVHVAAHEAGVEDDALDAILHDFTGDVSANGVDRTNVVAILDAIRAASDTTERNI